MNNNIHNNNKRWALRRERRPPAPRRGTASPADILGTYIYIYICMPIINNSKELCIITICIMSPADIIGIS